MAARSCWWLVCSLTFSIQTSPRSVAVFRTSAIHFSGSAHNAGCASHAPKTFTRMDVAERPVVIVLREQPINRAWRISVVPGPSCRARVKHGDVEAARHSLRILRGDIFQDLAFGKALPVDRDANFIEADRLGL